jgi:hypothetical protein
LTERKTGNADIWAYGRATRIKGIANNDIDILSWQDQSSLEQVITAALVAANLMLDKYSEH